MPSPNYRLFVLDNQATDVVQLSRAEAMIPCQGHRRQPELRLVPVASYVDVHRLVTVETVEEEPIRARDTWNLRHVALVLARIMSGSDASAKPGKSAS
jgi:hypothetical protein